MKPDIPDWLIEHRATVPPDTPISKAITYALNHWSTLYHYVEDGKVLPDNNGVELAIRPVTCTVRTRCSPVTTWGRAWLNNIDPFEYLFDIDDRIHDCPAHQLEELLPHKWVKLRPGCQ